MAIPESDLEIMARIGAQVTSSDTYATIKRALEADDTGYHDRRYKVFLQGSYGNDTNIIAESDVDVVIRLDAIFTYDLDNLTLDEKQAFQSLHPAATYNHVHFRNDVLAALKNRFGDQAKPGTKAVMIEPFHNRRKADVLIATQHRKYSRYGVGNDQYVEGISFHKSDGTRVVNYPEKHRDNLRVKNQATNEVFKRVVRIFKNVRSVMVAEGTIEAGGAPSYYVEGLLYNVPDHLFVGTYEDVMVNCINWLNSADRDRSSFACANMQYWLLRGNPDVTWNYADCDAFLKGLIHTWNNW